MAVPRTFGLARTYLHVDDHQEYTWPQNWSFLEAQANKVVDVWIYAGGVATISSNSDEEG